MTTIKQSLKIGLGVSILVSIYGRALIPVLMRTFGTAAGGFVAGFQSAVDTFGVRGMVKVTVAVALFLQLKRLGD